MECGPVTLVTKLCKSFAVDNASVEYITKLWKLAYNELLKKRPTSLTKTNTRMPSGDFMKLVHELLNKNDWDIYDRQYLDECIEDLMQCNETIETDSLLFSVIMFLISVTKSENSFEIDKPVGFEFSLEENCFQRRIRQFFRKIKLRNVPEEESYELFDLDNFDDRTYKPINSDNFFSLRPQYAFFENLDDISDVKSPEVVQINDCRKKENVTTPDEGFVTPDSDVVHGELLSTKLSCLYKNNITSISDDAESSFRLQLLSEPKFVTETKESIIHLTKLTQVNLGSSMLSFEVITADFIRDIKCLLHGIPSSSFLYSENDGLFMLRHGLYMKTATSELLIEYSDTFITCGNCYVALKKFIAVESKKSVDSILQTFYRCIREILQSYEKALFAFDWQSCTSLQSVLIFVERLKIRLRFIVEFCWITPGSPSSSSTNSKLPNGVHLLNYTYTSMQKFEENNMRFLLYYIFKECCNSYFKMLSEWMFNGECGTPGNNELFVQIDAEYVSCKDRRWLNSFVSNRNLIPHFLEHLLSDLEMCGKLILLLKDHWIEESQYKLLVQNRPKILYVFGDVQLEKYTNEWNGFYENCSPFFKVAADVRKIMKMSTPPQEYYDNIRQVQQKWMEEYERQHREQLLSDREKVRASQKAVKDSIDEFLEMKNAYKQMMTAKEKCITTDNTSNDLLRKEENSDQLTDGLRDEHLNTSPEKSNAIDQMNSGETANQKSGVTFVSAPLAYSDNVQIKADYFTQSPSADSGFSTGAELLPESESEYSVCRRPHHNREVKNKAMENKRKIMTSQLACLTPSFSSSSCSSLDGAVVDDETKSDTTMSSITGGGRVPPAEVSSWTEAARNKSKVLSSEFGCPQISMDEDNHHSKGYGSAQQVRDDNRRRMMRSSIVENNSTTNYYGGGDNNNNNNDSCSARRLVGSAAMENRLKCMSSEFDMFGRSEETPKIMKNNMSVRQSALLQNKDRIMSSEYHARLNEEADKITLLKFTAEAANNELASKKCLIISDGDDSYDSTNIDKSNVSSNDTDELTTIDNYNIIQTERDTVEEFTTETTSSSPSFSLRDVLFDDNAYDKIKTFVEASGGEWNFLRLSSSSDYSNKNNIDYLSSSVSSSTSVVDLSSAAAEKISFLDSRTVTKYLLLSVIIPLNVQSKIMTDAITILFIEKLRYFDCLTSLKKYFLFESNDLVSAAKNTLFPTLENAGGSSLNDFQLRCVLENITSYLEIRVSLRLDEPIILSNEEEITEKTPHREIADRISLHYSIRWPLNILITEEMIDDYNRIFKFLLRIHRARWSLQRNFCELKNWRNGRGQQYREIQMYRHGMLQFFVSIQIFVQYSVIQKCWEDLSRKFAENPVNLDTFYTYHKDYLDDILNRLMLRDTKNTFDFHKILSNLFECVCKFNLLLNAESWKMNASVRLMHHANYKELQNVYAEFMCSVKQLRYSLKHRIHNVNMHFASLYKSLLYNLSD